MRLATHDRGAVLDLAGANHLSPALRDGQPASSRSRRRPPGASAGSVLRRPRPGRPGTHLQHADAAFGPGRFRWPRPRPLERHPTFAAAMDRTRRFVRAFLRKPSTLYEAVSRSTEGVLHGVAALGTRSPRVVARQQVQSLPDGGLERRRQRVLGGLCEIGHRIGKDPIYPWACLHRSRDPHLPPGPVRVRPGVRGDRHRPVEGLRPRQPGIGQPQVDPGCDSRLRAREDGVRRRGVGTRRPPSAARRRTRPAAQASSRVSREEWPGRRPLDRFERSRRTESRPSRLPR